MAPNCGAKKFDTLKFAKKFEIRPTMTSNYGTKKFDQRFDIQKFETPLQCRIRGPVRIPTPFLNCSTKKSKCQPARVLPASREEPGSPRTRCTTDPVRHRTHQEFDWQFNRKYQQHQEQFDREHQQQFDRKFTQNFQKIDVDPEDQFDRKFIQNFHRKSVQEPDRKFDADPTEKFNLSNLNQIV